MEAGAVTKPASPTPQVRFLMALSEGLSVAGAAKLAGLGRQTVYDWRKRDRDFAAAWDEALETGTDNLEDEARRRAMSSSDTLMIFLLKARRPEKYKERYAAEHTGKDGGPIRTAYDLSPLSDDQLAALRGMHETLALARGESLPSEPDAEPQRAQ